MIALALAVGPAALVVTLVVLARVARVHVQQLGGHFERLEAAVRATGEPAEADMRRRVADLEDLTERLPQRWEEFKNEARRAEDRARKIVGSAREELAEHGFEHAGVEAQARELHLVDAGGGEAEGLPAVPESMEGPEPTAEDWREAVRRRKFGG